MIMEIMAEPAMEPMDGPAMEPNPPAVVVHIGEGLGPHRSKGRRLASQGYFK